MQSIAVSRVTISVAAPRAPKLNKANARDVAKARRLLGQEGGNRYYAATLSAIHRSSSLAQQREVEAAIVADGMGHLFRRQAGTDCMMIAEGL